MPSGNPAAKAAVAAGGAIVEGSATIPYGFSMGGIVACSCIWAATSSFVSKGEDDSPAPAGDGTHAEGCGGRVGKDESLMGHSPGWRGLHRARIAIGIPTSLTGP